MWLFLCITVRVGWLYFFISGTCPAQIPQWIFTINGLKACKNYYHMAHSVLANFATKQRILTLKTFTVLSEDSYKLQGLDVALKHFFAVFVVSLTISWTLTMIKIQVFLHFIIIIQTDPSGGCLEWTAMRDSASIVLQKSPWIHTVITSITHVSSHKCYCHNIHTKFVYATVYCINCFFFQNYFSTAVYISSICKSIMQSRQTMSYNECCGCCIVEQ